MLLLFEMINIYIFFKHNIRYFNILFFCAILVVVIQGNYWQNIVEFYTNLICQSTFAIINFFGNYSQSNKILWQIITKSVLSNSIYDIIAFRYYFMLIFFSFFVFGKATRNILLFNLFAALIFLLTIGMLCVKITSFNQLQYGIVILLSDLRYVSVIIFLHITSKNYLFLSHLFSVLNGKMKSYIGLPIAPILIFVLMVRGVKNIIEYFLFKSGSFDYLINFEVSLTNSLLRFFGYNTHVINNYICLDPYWVQIITPCLGLGMMIVFALLIAIIRSNWLNKLLFILLGEVIIILLNAFRIALLLLHIRSLKGEQKITMEVHNWSGHLFYVFVFILFLIYLHWFQNIQFQKFFRKFSKSMKIDSEFN